MRFDSAVSADAAASTGSKLLDFDKDDLMRGVELLIMGVVATLIIFFVVRPLLTTAGGGGPPMAFAGMRALPAGPGGGGAGGGMGQLTHDPQTGQPLALPAPTSEIDNRIDIAKIEGQVRVSSVKSVSEFVEKHPEESVSILRSWLHEA